MEQKTQNLNQDGLRTLALLIVTGLNIMEATYPGEYKSRWPSSFNQMISYDLNVTFRFWQNSIWPTNGGYDTCYGKAWYSWTTIFW